MQLKDIPDRAVLREVRRLSMISSEAAASMGLKPPHWVMAWDLEKALGLEAEPLDRLFRGKTAALIRRKLLEGCPCGCRGDYEMTIAGNALLDAHCNVHDDCLRHDALARACLERTTETGSTST